MCSSRTKKAAKKATKNAERHKLLKSMELWRGKSVSTSFVTRVFPLANGRGGKALGTRLCLSRVVLRFFLLQSVCKTPIMHLAFPPNLHKHCLQFLLGQLQPRRGWKQSYAKLWGHTRCITEDVKMTNLIVQLTDLATVIYTKTDIKEINKQCFVE